MKIPVWAREAIKKLNKLREQGIVPDVEYVYSGNRVGSWRMLPNGATVFYTPIDYEEQYTNGGGKDGKNRV